MTNDFNTLSSLKFKKYAELYCALIEDREKYGLGTFLSACTRLFAQLYLKAEALPDLGKIIEERSGASITHEEWVPIYKGLSKYLGDYDLYSMVFDPFDSNNSRAISHTLADDLADIYRDLKKGLIDIERENGLLTANVVWDWKFSFESHWGRHLTNAMNAIHSIRFVHLNEDE
jgi:hypothetical protein